MNSFALTTGMLLAVATACGGVDSPPGSVEIFYGRYDMPIEGVLVGSNTSGIQTRTDASGHATLLGIGADARVWLFDACESCGAAFIDEIRHVQPGEVLTIGAGPPAPTGLGRMTVDIASPPPVDFTYLEVVSSCAVVAATVGTTYTLDVDDRCGGRANVLVRAKKKVSMTYYETVSYAFEEVPFEEAGTLVVRDWAAPVFPDVMLAPPIPFDLKGRSITNDGIAGDVLVVPIPLKLDIYGNVNGGQETVSATLPAVATQTVNLGDYFAPLIRATQTGGMTVSLSPDTLGETLSSNYAVIELQYAWTNGASNYVYRVFEDPSSSGDSVDGELPAALQNFAPQSTLNLVTAFAHRFDNGLSYADVHAFVDVPVSHATPFTWHAFSVGF